jgi:phage/plasmid-associated DNA primase
VEFAALVRHARRAGVRVVAVEARLKALTGRDPMTARFLNQEFFTFIPVCKIWIATNNKPKSSGRTTASGAASI